MQKKGFIYHDSMKKIVIKMFQAKIKVTLRKWIDKGGRVRQYFIRGHSNWFALVLSLINFTLIFYNLLFKNLFFVPDVLKSYSVFFIIFGVLYFPMAAILGWLDFKKGTYKAEQVLTMEVSPIWREVFQKLQNLEEANVILLSELKKIQDV
ncbi:MAG: hypothetical protein ACFFAJ_00530 [Candidatus Hodarchaeota archaeon]